MQFLTYYAKAILVGDMITVTSDDAALFVFFDLKPNKFVKTNMITVQQNNYSAFLLNF